MEQKGYFFSNQILGLRNLKEMINLNILKTNLHIIYTNTVTILRKQTSKACAYKYAYFYQNKFFKFFKCKITRSQAINSKYWEQYNQVHVTDTQVTTTNPT